ncbi:hypothetical protein ABNN70_10660 [Sporolactobacillus sp. Y61]|jgi:hypothetical protein|uniref:Uncharacterized protein n=1 Tax=Sporolactobacillus sp. Y61 TaxID=3160863 RepID=A0AAU8ICR5_9BACL|nr:hypothetical protein [Sporolactobacillus sp. THM19-2]RYL92198.1 hypothetical protein EWH91_08180 [Sporolactobacillus sp. THM19-2]
MNGSELTITEKRMIRRYIFLPLIRMALERDRRIIALTRTKFKTAYLNVIDIAINRVTADMRINKDEIFEHHIHMTRKNWLNYEVYTRGRVFQVSYHKSTAGDWIYERIGQYLGSG